MNKLDALIDKLPMSHYVCEKALWVGNICVGIDHIDNDLDKPLNYEKAFKDMLYKLGVSAEELPNE